MRNRWQRFWNSRSGNFGIITGLLVVPLAAAAGLAMDISNAMSVRTQMFDAADAAAIGSVADSSPGFAQALKMKADGVIPMAQADARKMFLAQNTFDPTPDAVQVDAGITKTGNVLKSYVTFSAKVPTTFMRILGRDEIDISGTATADYTTGTFMDFYMLLDNSPSMGLGATEAAIKTLQDASPENCAYACHIVPTSDPAKQAACTDPAADAADAATYAKAHASGQLRMDVVAAAASQLIKTAKDDAVDHIKVATYSFGKTADDPDIRTVAALTSDLASAATATAAIELMSIPCNNYHDDQMTSYDAALNSLNKKIGTGGMGTSTADTQKIVFFVGDGVGDSDKPKNCTKPLVDDTRCIEPIDTLACQKLKDHNVKIAVLYTTYFPLPGDDFYDDYVAGFQDSIGAKMKECASPDLYFEVSPTDGIQKAMDALFKKIIHVLRISS